MGQGIIETVPRVEVVHNKTNTGQRTWIRSMLNGPTLHTLNGHLHLNGLTRFYILQRTPSPKRKVDLGFENYKKKNKKV